MFAKDLVVLGVARAVPAQAFIFDEELGAAALAAAFGDPAIEATNPRFDARRLVFDEFYATATMNSPAVADIGGSSEFPNTFKAQETNNRCVLTSHMFIISQRSNGGEARAVRS